MKLKRPSSLPALLLAFGLLGVSALARADLVYDLTVGNAAISGFPGPYGSVNVHLTATGAVLTYTANAGYRFGDGGFADANFGAGFSGFVSCTEDNGGGTGFTPGTCSDGGSANVDGFGTFIQTTDNTDGFQDSAIQVVLTVNGTWATENDVLAKNNKGWFLAAHIFVCDEVDANGCVQSGGAVNTGYAANGSGPRPEVPEPQSLALLGVGLIGLGLIRRRRPS